MVKANRISQPQATARRGWAREEVCRRGEERGGRLREVIGEVTTQEV